MEQRRTVAGTGTKGLLLSLFSDSLLFYWINLPRAGLQAFLWMGIV